MEKSSFASISTGRTKKQYKKRKDLDALRAQRCQSPASVVPTGLHFGDSYESGQRLRPDVMANASSDEDISFVHSVKQLAFPRNSHSNNSLFRHVPTAEQKRILALASAKIAASFVGLLIRTANGLYWRVFTGRCLVPGGGKRPLRKNGSCSNARFFAYSTLILAVFVCISTVLCSLSLWLFFDQKLELEAARNLLQVAHSAQLNAPRGTEWETNLLALSSRIETVEMRLAALNSTIGRDVRVRVRVVPCESVYLHLDMMESRIASVQRSLDDPAFPKLNPSLFSINTPTRRQVNEADIYSDAAIESC